MEHSLFKAQGEIGAPKASAKSNGPETVNLKVVDLIVFVMEETPKMVIQYAPGVTEVEAPTETLLAQLV